MIRTLIELFISIFKRTNVTQSPSVTVVVNPSDYSRPIAEVQPSTLSIDDVNESSIEEISDLVVELQRIKEEGDEITIKYQGEKHKI